MDFHLVRIGALGDVGQFRSADGTRYPRRSRVVVRTERGLELGEVLAPPEADRGARAFDAGPGDGVAPASNAAPPASGVILRGMTSQDRLLEARLDKNRRAAFAACERRIAELDLPAALVDVECLFDGRALCFYFLGETTPALDALTAGCGPDCGSEDGAGCQSCGTGCAVAGACGTRSRRATVSPET